MTDGKGGTILIIEDDEGVALLERLRLVRAGYEVAVASTLAEARDRISQGNVDLLVLDYRLDGLTTGLEFYRSLRELGLDIPSILVSGFRDETILAEALRSGIRDFLPKTKDYLDFIGPTVERVLKQVRTERQLAASQAEVVALAKRARSEQALREAQEWVRLMIESVRDYAIFAVDTDGRIASWNTGAERLFGFTEQEIVGRRLDYLYLPEDRAARAPARELSKARDLGRAEDERWHLRKDGSRFFASGMVTTMRDQDGNLVGYTKIARDMTDRKKAEEALLASEAALKETDRRKDEFLAMLAHELRNPLSALSGALDVAREVSSPSDQFWAREVMERQVKHLTHLIDDLLDVSRISQGKIRLRKKSLDINSIIERAVETVRPMIEQKKQHFSITIPHDPITIEGDPTRLEQVIVNLLANAMKYTEPNGSIELSAGFEASEVVVIVKDNGVGIPKEMQKSVFNLFTQMDRSLDRSQGGLGIGLTLVNTLVQLHGGRVELESEGIPGKGSCFKVWLPRSAPFVPDSVSSSGEFAVPKSFQTRSYRFLVVDDNVDAARALARWLQVGRHEVQTAFDGEQALSRLESYIPDVILLDIGLPKLDGYQVAQRVRSDERFSRTLLVAVSGYGQPQDRLRAKHAGFDKHFIKPVAPETIENLIAELQQGTFKVSR